MTINVKAEPMDWTARAHELGPQIAARAEAADANDAFVSETMKLLKDAGFHAAAVPAVLGGGGATPAELSGMLRALALPAWRWHRTPEPVEGLLKRVVAEKLTLVSSGGSDWLDGSCDAVPVEGGFRVSGRKIFASGCPLGDLLVTMAVQQTPEGPTVLHLAIPLKAQGVTILDTWRTLGMRGTGSHDIELADVFVPDAAVTVRRPSGKWHPLMHMVTMIAFPLIYSVYVGLAEAARDKAVAMAARKTSDDLTQIVGEMDTELAAARMALADMLAVIEVGEPGEAASNRVMMGRTLVARSAIRTVEKAMEAAGGGAFYRKVGLERIWRDVQAARYHPLQEKAQARLAGRVALGLPVDG